VENGIEVESFRAIYAAFRLSSRLFQRGENHRPLTVDPINRKARPVMREPIRSHKQARECHLRTGVCPSEPQYAITQLADLAWTSWIKAPGLFLRYKRRTNNPIQGQWPGDPRRSTIIELRP
jgi:hypothetical protein